MVKCAFDSDIIAIFALRKSEFILTNYNNMKSIYYVIVGVCLFVASSCCTMRTTTVTKVMSPQTGDIIANLDVRTERITHTYVVESENKDFTKIDDLKSNAVYEALKKINGDVLVAPQYKINREICKKSTTFTIEVSGYPAFYTNFRQMPIGEKCELRELKEGASYVIVTKSSDNNDVDIDRNIIVVPVRSGCHVIDMDQTTLDKVVFKGKNRKNDVSETCEQKKRCSEDRDYSKNVENNKFTKKEFSGKSTMNFFKNIKTARSAKKSAVYSYEQSRKIKLSGISLTSIGTLFVIMGCAFTPLGDTELVASFSALGSLSLMAGIPLWCVGNSRVKKSSLSYNNPRQFSGVSLSLQGGNGIGLALRF